MPSLRPRFTIRWLMSAVAVAAFPCWMLALAQGNPLAMMAMGFTLVCFGMTGVFAVLAAAAGILIARLTSSDKPPEP